MSEDTGNATDTGEQKAKDNPQGAQGKNEQTQGLEGQNTPKGAQPGSVPFARFQEVVQARKGLEATLNSLIDEMVPEEMRDLVPPLPAAEKAAWIKAAKERGLFDKGGESVSPQASSPDAKRPGGKQQIDLEGMTSTEKLQFGFSQRK